jgi:alkylhydroperoxidase family enzyme
MARIHEITKETANDAQREILAEQEAAGGVYNTTRIWAHRPATLKGLGAFAEALEGESTLPPGLVHLTRVRVAQINGCPF